MLTNILIETVQPPFFLVSQTWRNPQQLETLCQSVYFPLEPVTAGALALLHGLLYHIIRDYLHEQPADLAHYDLSSSAAFCERQFSSALQNHDMMVNPTIEKVQALLIGVGLFQCLAEAGLTVSGHQSSGRI